MHKYLNEYPPVPEWREEDAVKRFPYKEMSAEEYAAREAHNWVCFSYDEYIYNDSELNEWIHSLGDIFFTKGAVRAEREKHLTREQIKNVMRSASKTTNNAIASIINRQHSTRARLQRIADADHAEVWLKLEGANPTGSYKDRMVLSQVRNALGAGNLAEAIALECTGGSTGTSLACVCAALGLPCAIITSDAFSRDKTDSMKAFGANVIIEECENGKITPSLWQRMRTRAAQMHESGSYFWLDQFNNSATLLAFEAFADEVLAVQPEIDAFCAAVGTAGMLVGAGRRFRQTLPEMKIVAVEPQSCSVLSGNPPGPHTVDGTAAGFVPPLYDNEIVDSVIAIDEQDARVMCNRLAKEEGVFAGTSTGLNVCAALQLARSLGPDRRIVTVACDTGFKYMSGTLFQTVDNA